MEEMGKKRFIYSKVYQFLWDAEYVIYIFY